MIKPAFNDNRKKLYQLLPLKTPLSVNIEPSSFCNIKCNYCAQSLDFNNVYFTQRIMSSDIFNRVATQLKEFPDKIKKVHLFRNGEPLLNPSIAFMVEKLKSEKIVETINISTNGLLLSKNVSNDLIESGLDILTVSMQGITNKSYNNFAKANIDIELLYEQLEYFYNNRKNCKLYIKNIDIALDQKEREIFYNKYSKISDRVFIESACKVYRDVDYSNINVNTTRYGENYGIPKACQILFYHLHILADGTIIPCNSIDNPIELGNVKSTTLLKAWNSKKRHKLMIQHLSFNKNDNNVCKDCLRLLQEVRKDDYIDNNIDEIKQKLIKAAADE